MKNKTYKRTTDAMMKWKSDNRGKKHFYRYYSELLYKWDGIERCSSDACFDNSYDSIITKKGKINGSLI